MINYLPDAEYVVELVIMLFLDIHGRVNLYIYIRIYLLTCIVILGRFTLSQYSILSTFSFELYPLSLPAFRLANQK